MVAVAAVGCASEVEGRARIVISSKGKEAGCLGSLGMKVGGGEVHSYIGRVFTEVIW